MVVEIEGQLVEGSGITESGYGLVFYNMHWTSSSFSILEKRREGFTLRKRWEKVLSNIYIVRFKERERDVPTIPMLRWFKEDEGKCEGGRSATKED
ncbi:hypothetical protein TSUD_329170 [Trifolium subterraneum]|uniref:Uncharacterized protein n=1 Tax=Trifolium subterraneum TaxID=3900 RepID=A0A2Z6LWU3_TRISU|nr:hypothetical protein TSUD_329170 [Trifolium subterraneum]